MQFKLSVVVALVLAASGALALPKGVDPRQVDCSVFSGEAKKACEQATAGATGGSATGGNSASGTTSGGGSCTTNISSEGVSVSCSASA